MYIETYVEICGHRSVFTDMLIGMYKYKHAQSRQHRNTPKDAGITVESDAPELGSLDVSTVVSAVWGKGCE